MGVSGPATHVAGLELVSLPISTLHRPVLPGEAGRTLAEHTLQLLGQLMAARWAFPGAAWGL